MADETLPHPTLEDAVFRRLLDAAPDAMFVVDTRGVIVFASAQSEPLLGYSRGELEGASLDMLVPVRYRNAHVHHRAAFFARPSTRPMGAGADLVARRKDGSEIPVEISLSEVMTPQGPLVAASMRDVTWRRQAEAAARQANERLASAVESLQGAIAVLDREDRLLMCNSACRVLFGALTGDPLGVPFPQLLERVFAAGSFDSEDEPREASLARWLAYHRQPVGTLDVTTSDGRSLRVTQRPTPEGGAVITLWDITEDARREADVRRARAAAEAASHAKSEFLASMSHELRTPLNAILGFAQLLQRDRKTPLSERQQERVSHVLKAGEHLLRLIDEVLDLARIEAGRVQVSIEPVEVSTLLEEVGRTLGPMAERAAIALQIIPGPIPPPIVAADRTRLAQILINFGSNAIKYGKRGGHVTFSVDQHEGLVRVKVSDDGMGIPDKSQDKIFQPFQRAGQETGPIEGTGIGLAISRRLAGIMAASVGFHSVEGQGSDFWIDLQPRQPDPSPPAATVSTAPPLALSGGRRRTILYIEDNPSNIALLEDLLGDMPGIELQTVPTAEIGIELARAHRPAVIIMDIHLPGMSGIEATRRLRSWPETRNIPIVALTAAAMLRDTRVLSEAGMDHLLTKPVKIDELIDVLERMLAQPTAPERP